MPAPPGWPQAPRPVVTPGVGKQAWGGSPAQHTSALPASVPTTSPLTCFFQQWV